MPKIDRYPNHPTFASLTRGSRKEGIKSLLPLAQPDVAIYEGRMTLEEFEGALQEARDEHFEDYVLAFARAIGAVLVYGQFPLTGANRAAAYTATRSFVPRIRPDSLRLLEQSGFYFTGQSEYSTRVSFPRTVGMDRPFQGRKEALHSLKIPLAPPLDRVALARATVEEQERPKGRELLHELLGLTSEKERTDVAVAEADMRAQLERGFSGLYESQVWVPGKPWTGLQSTEEWNDIKIKGVHKGIQVAIDGAELVAQFINEELDAPREAEIPGVTICIPVLHSESGTHPLYQQLVHEGRMEEERAVRWHAERALTVQGSTLEELYSRIMRGETF